MSTQTYKGDVVISKMSVTPPNFQYCKTYNTTTSMICMRNFVIVFQPKFANFAEDFKNHIDGYQRMFDSVDPHR